jgi:hypothetical protein
MDDLVLMNDVSDYTDTTATTANSRLSTTTKAETTAFAVRVPARVSVMLHRRSQFQTAV